MQRKPKQHTSIKNNMVKNDDENWWKLMKIDENWWKLMKIDENWWKLMKIDGKCVCKEMGMNQYEYINFSVVKLHFEDIECINSRLCCGFLSFVPVLAGVVATNHVIGDFHIKRWPSVRRVLFYAFFLANNPHVHLTQRAHSSALTIQVGCFFIQNLLVFGHVDRTGCRIARHRSGRGTTPSGHEAVSEGRRRRAGAEANRQHIVIEEDRLKTKEENKHIQKSDQNVYFFSCTNQSIDRSIERISINDMTPKCTRTLFSNSGTNESYAYHFGLQQADVVFSRVLIVQWMLDEPLQLVRPRVRLQAAGYIMFSHSNRVGGSRGTAKFTKIDPCFPHCFFGQRKLPSSILTFKKTHATASQQWAAVRTQWWSIWK